MFWFEIGIILVMLCIGARIGGLGLGMAGGLGMTILVFGLKLTPASPPVNVILIIASVILAASTLQAAGGMDYLVSLAEKLLRKNPGRITILAPLIAYVFSFMTGTGYVVFSLLPVIAEVARESGVRPERPLSISVVASQQALTGSPISAATAVMIGLMLSFNIGLVDIMKVCVPATLLGVLAGALYASRMGKELEKDPVYLDRLAKGEVPPLVKGSLTSKEYSKEAKLSVILFVLGSILVVLFGSIPELRPVLKYAGKMQSLPMPNVIEIVMMTVALIMVVACKVKVDRIAEGSVFRAGMMGVIIVFGVAWMSDTVVDANTALIKGGVQAVVSQYPWLFVLAVFAVSVLTASQAVTTAAMMPLGIALGVPAAVLVGIFPAVCSYFFLPTSTAMVASVAIDSTGTTRIGKYVLNHSYMMPGLVTMIVCIGVGLTLAKVLL
jgi:anaerobic C4-dicarboxylate transporter-like protein